MQNTTTSSQRRRRSLNLSKVLGFLTGRKSSPNGSESASPTSIPDSLSLIHSIPTIPKFSSSSSSESSGGSSSASARRRKLESTSSDTSHQRSTERILPTIKSVPSSPHPSIPPIESLIAPRPIVPRKTAPPPPFSPSSAPSLTKKASTRSLRNTGRRSQSSNRSSGSAPESTNGSTPEESTRSSPSHTLAKRSVSVDAQEAEREYLALLEEQRGRIRPLMAAADGKLSKELVEEAGKSLLTMRLGEGYPDTSVLQVGSGGKLLLPSEREGVRGSGVIRDDGGRKDSDH
ncbi:hypothetical protein HDU98_002670 [Podochytrium sp. JEL0797]|nr:hypothetical protein HDU98_002670 [Podochytrium sp. JEL0797]